MANLKLLFVAVLMLAGCSYEQPVPPDSHMTVSSAFSALEMQAALDGASQWETATGGVVHSTASIGDDGAIRVYPGVVDGDTIGQTDANGTEADIRLNMPLVREWAKKNRVSEITEFQDTVMHEMGHAFGLHHMAKGLMIAQGFGGACIDRETLDAFCTLYGCPASAVPTCN